uniref:Interleukin-12 subunit beta n=1 Tax=Mola mola TaxID=94237 RepID=A0A3Q3WHQ6_MOLML
GHPARKTLSQGIFGLLFIIVLVIKDEDPVTLSCNTTIDSNITWKFHGEVTEDVALEDGVQQNGKNLTLSDVGANMLGEYTCWAEGQKLSSIYLLRKAEEENSSLHCWAKSYDCNFGCKWNDTRFTEVRLGLGHNCAEGQKSCHWVKSSEKLQDGGFQFQLFHSLLPYAEESTMLEVTAEAKENFNILRTTKKFYLRDIIRPDSPQLVKCEELEKGLNVIIKPPSTWSTPHSFFSLEHEIEYVQRDDGQTKNSSFPLIPKKISKLRVRSRDSLVQSAWSEWSPWNNVKY